MGLFNWLFGRSGDSKEAGGDAPVICICEKCKVQYCIGADAIVTTLEETMGLLQHGKGIDFGQPSSTPDRVSKARASLSDAGYRIVCDARKAGQIRLWKCDCGHGQPYTWCREAVMKKIRQS